MSNRFPYGHHARCVGHPGDAEALQCAHRQIEVLWRHLDDAYSEGSTRREHGEVLRVEMAMMRDLLGRKQDEIVRLREVVAVEEKDRDDWKASADLAQAEIRRLVEAHLRDDWRNRAEKAEALLAQAVAPTLENCSRHGVSAPCRYCFPAPPSLVKHSSVFRPLDVCADPACAWCRPRVPECR